MNDKIADISNIKISTLNTKISNTKILLYYFVYDLKSEYL